MTESAELEHGWHLLEIGRSAEAAAIAQRAVRANPGDSAALCLLADCLTSQGQPHQAEAVARRAALLDPDDAHPLLALSQALAAQGWMDAAMEAALDAVEIAPHDSRVHYETARIMLGHPNGNVGTAHRHAVEALTIDSSDPDHHVMVGATLLQLGNKGHAKQAFRDALAIDPTNEYATAALAAEQVGFFRVRRALGLVSSGLSQKPNAAVLHESAATIGKLLVSQLSILLSVGWTVLAVMAVAGADRWIRLPAAAICLVGVIFLWWLRTRPLPTALRRSPRRFAAEYGIGFWSLSYDALAAVTVALIGVLPLDAAQYVAIASGILGAMALVLMMTREP